MEYGPFTYLTVSINYMRKTVGTSYDFYEVRSFSLTQTSVFISATVML